MSTATLFIREIVSAHPSASRVLDQFEIDVWLQADLSLERACRELQLSVDQVQEKLAEAASQEPGGRAPDPSTTRLGRLIQQIVRVHHHVVRQQLPRLAQSAARLAATRGGRAPELAQIAAALEKLRAEMLAHIEKEENVLFPFISHMDEEAVVAYPPEHARFRSVAHPIFMMEQEHEGARHILAELNRLTHGFEPSASACPDQIELYSQLRAFEADLREHIHLENDVLFPRAMQLESDLNARS